VNTFAGLLRAVNVAGRNAIAMDDLREFLTALGMRDVRTLLQSGNFVARGSLGDAAALEQRLAREAQRRLGLATEFFLRTPEECASLIAANPFPREAKSDPARLHAVFLRAAPPRASVAKLEQAITGRERVKAVGRHLAVHYPDGAGQSKLTNAVIERHLGGAGTARNWNTVLKLDALMSAG
jgi:uncharacterized protein (DUF1697 family)